MYKTLHLAQRYKILNLNLKPIGIDTKQNRTATNQRHFFYIVKYCKITKQYCNQNVGNHVFLKNKTQTVERF